MIELIRALKVIGLGPLLNLARAHRYVWSNILGGFYSSRVIQVLFNVGFFDEMHLHGGVEIAEFARANNLDESTLKMLCDYLYCIQILNKQNSNYVLDTKGALSTETGRGWFEATYGYKDVYYYLEDILRKEKEYGKDVFRDSVLIARGSGTMESKIFYPIAIATLKKNRFSHVLDLGCGDCGFLIQLCRSDPRFRGYGLDLSREAILVGKDEAMESGVQDRILLECQDITKLKRTPDGWSAIDAATAFFVLHEILYQGHDKVVDFLRSYKELFPEVPLFVFEVHRASIEKTRKRSGMSPHYFLQHDLTHQKLVSRREWKELFKTAGFRSIEERYLRFVRTSIFTIH